ncbi:hypothetical protein [Hymenobacter algoricola]
MENPENKRVRTLVNHWLQAHPNRIRNRRQRPEMFQGWKLAAMRYLRQGNPHDTNAILTWFATQAEGSAMED